MGIESVGGNLKRPPETPNPNLANMLAQRDIRGQRGKQKLQTMFLTLCQELREIFIEEDTESCFGDDSDEAGGTNSKKMPLFEARESRGGKLETSICFDEKEGLRKSWQK